MNSGFIQYGDTPPSTSLLPNDALAWLVNCQHPAEVGWIFFGRWLFLDQSRNHSRHWCSMDECGTQMKQRRFVERRRSRGATRST